MNRRLHKQLKMAFQAPSPTHKKEFIRQLPYPKASLIETLISQVGYIRKQFWLLSILLLGCLLALLGLTDYDYETMMLLSAGMPLFTLMSIVEMSRSSSFNMDELEMSCKYNLTKVTLIRLSAMGSFYFFIFLVLAATLGRLTEYSFLRAMVYIMTPFLLSSNVSMWIINHLKIKDTIYLCGGVTGFISIAVFAFTGKQRVIYEGNYVIIWASLCLVLILCLVVEIRKYMKRSEEMQCHLL